MMDDLIYIMKKQNEEMNAEMHSKAMRYSKMKTALAEDCQ